MQTDLIVLNLRG